MKVYDHALARWVGDGDDELRRTGAMVLEPLLGSDDGEQALAAVVLSEVVVQLPIKGTGRTRPLTTTGALSLTVEMIRAGQVDMAASAVVAGAEILRIVTGVHDDVRQAAFAAVRQLGIGRVGLRPWMIAALEDPETPDDAVPRQVINAVDLAVRNTSPGLSWTGYAHDLGYVLYRRS
jgi:hypothetical protein